MLVSYQRRDDQRDQKGKIFHTPNSSSTLKMSIAMKDFSNTLLRDLFSFWSSQRV